MLTSKKTRNVSTQRTLLVKTFNIFKDSFLKLLFQTFYEAALQKYFKALLFDEYFSKSEAST